MAAKSDKEKKTGGDSAPKSSKETPKKASPKPKKEEDEDDEDMEDEELETPKDAKKK